MRILWSDHAIDQLEQIHHYIAQDSEAVAMMWVRGLLDFVERRDQFPRSGRAVKEFPGEEYREWIFGSYRIIYREYEDRLEILAIVHGARLLNDSSVDI